MNVTDPIRHRAAAEPNAVALIRADDIPITYRALDAAIDNCARQVLAHGIQPGQTIGLAITGPDEPLTVILSLALARLGIASAEPNLPPHHLTAILHQQGAAPPGPIRAIAVDQTWLTGAGPPVTAQVNPNAVLRVFSTSGTTGSPRFCAVTHADMAARVARAPFPEIPLPGSRADTRTIMICAMGLGGTVAYRRILIMLGAGGTLVFTNPDQFANAVLRHKVNFLAASVRTLQALVAKIPPGIGPLPTLRATIATGSHLPAALARDVMARLCPNLYTSFGATETSHIAVGKFGEFAHIPHAIGRVIPSVQAQAVDRNDQPLPPGQEGLLRFRTPGMAREYLDDPETTAHVFRNGWFHSGDTGAVTADGILTVAGRTGDFINYGGVKVNPRIIEAALLELPDITEAVAFAVPDNHGLAQIYAAIAATPPIPAERLNRHCATRLGAQAPVMVMQLRALPRNANGKVMVRELIAHATRST